VNDRRFDANILASAAVSTIGTSVTRVVDAWRRGEFDVVVSDHILGELRRALADPYFTKRLSDETISDYLSLVRVMTTTVPISVDVRGVAPHPGDDLVLATAVSAGASYVVTGDRRFRAFAPEFRGVRVVGPSEFLQMLGASPSGSG
jgi:putative PIN family toxin of toxin-antitoxin system